MPKRNFSLVEYLYKKHNEWRERNLRDDKAFRAARRCSIADKETPFISKADWRRGVRPRPEFGRTK